MTSSMARPTSATSQRPLSPSSAHSRRSTVQRLWKMIENIENGVQSPTPRGEALRFLDLRLRLLDRDWASVPDAASEELNELHGHLAKLIKESMVGSDSSCIYTPSSGEVPDDLVEVASVGKGTKSRDEMALWNLIKPARREGIESGKRFDNLDIRRSAGLDHAGHPSHKTAPDDFQKRLDSLSERLEECSQEIRRSIEGFAVCIKKLQTQLDGLDKAVDKALNKSENVGVSKAKGVGVQKAEQSQPQCGGPGQGRYKPQENVRTEEPLTAVQVLISLKLALGIIILLSSLTSLMQGSATPALTL